MEQAERTLLIKLLDSFATTEKVETPPETPSYLSEPTEYIAKLNKRKSLLGEKSDFQVGDIIVWKDGLKNKRFPQYGEPCIIIHKYPEPIKEIDASYTEELDIQVGLISSDDEFLCFNYDSKRFKKHS